MLDLVISLFIFIIIIRMNRLIANPTNSETFHQETPKMTRVRLQGPVVQKPIDANPGLKLNGGFNFSGLKDFQKLIFCCLHVKTNQKQSIKAKILWKNLQYLITELESK